MRQLRNDPFCSENEFVGFEFLSTHPTGIAVCLDFPEPRIVSCAFAPAGLTQPREVFSSRGSHGLMGSSWIQEKEVLVGWARHEHDREEWSFLEAWHTVQGVARRRAWTATLRDDLLFVATRPRGCRALEELLGAGEEPGHLWKDSQD